ncbi:MULTISPECIES: hypothetical protein [Saccharothrix]|uniref:hypothetical protein n=1 Tax=Saccharothrix TaxID=2071 RepID=UPI000AB36CA1|nr:hypothetical protein [Saccharothrix sp. CB00851]
MTSATRCDRRAYLVRITARQALHRLRALGRRKESYVGSWLPEPLLTAPDVAADVELADSVSMAMLLVLETLAPTERAVFVLREVLGYDEIAAFQRAVDTGDLQGLLDILAPDVVLLGDGGGVVRTATRPVVGADRVARLLAGRLGRLAAASLHPVEVNGHPALVLRLDGEVDTVLAVRVDDGLVTGIYAVRNPAKLSHLDRETALDR